MATPTVTIKVPGGAPTAPTVAQPEAGLYMLYVQAVKGNERRQWVIFPPANTALGIPETLVKHGNPVLMLSRTQTFKGNRAKWFHHKVYPNAPGLTEELTASSGDGWTVGGLTVVPLELDDYQAVWQGDTPHKAMRAIDRTIQKAHGLSVK